MRSTSPTRRAAPLPADERRAAIIARVLPLLTERGRSATSQELAAAAGVAEGTIFNVFGCKDDLLAAVLDAALDQAPFEEAIGAIDPDAPFDEQLLAATQLIQHRIVDVWRLLSGIGSPELQAGRPLPISPALTELFERHVDSLSVEPVAAAHLLRALTLSLTHPMLTTEVADAHRIVDVFLNGVSVRP